MPQRVKRGDEQIEIIQQITDALKELRDDATVPRNVKLKLQNTITILEKQVDVSLRVDRAHQELDEIADDVNLQPYTRTQIWSIVSMLEKI